MFLVLSLLCWNAGWVVVVQMCWIANYTDLYKMRLADRWDGHWQVVDLRGSGRPRVMRLSGLGTACL